MCDNDNVWIAEIGLAGYIFALSRRNWRAMDCARTSAIQTIAGGRGHFSRPRMWDMVDSDQMQVEDKTNDRKYFTMLPNIIWEIGLSCYDLALYAYIKRIAGESGLCWQAMRTIAKQTGMSLSAIDDSRKVLESKGLISCTKRKHGAQGWAAWHISIMDVWQKNVETMAQKRSQDEQTKALPAGTDMPKALPVGTDAKQNCSQDAHKEEPYKSKKNHFEEEREGAAKNAPPAPTPRDHDPIDPRDRKRHHLPQEAEPSDAVKLYLQACNEAQQPRAPCPEVRAAIDTTVIDLDHWREHLHVWMMKGYRLANVADLLETYKTGLGGRHNGRSYQTGRGATNDVIKTPTGYTADA